MPLNKKILFFILLLAAFLRLFNLGSVPAGITNDEMGYIYNAYSLAKTGNNVFGESWPFLTWIYRQGFPFMPVTTYFIAPFVGLFGLTATTARLPSALLGILDVFLIYALVKLLFKSNKLALLSSLFLAISPWHLFLSRTAYDANFAFFFYLLGTTLFITTVSSRKPRAFMPEDEGAAPDGVGSSNKNLAFSKNLVSRYARNTGVTKTFRRKPNLSFEMSKETPSLRTGGGFIWEIKRKKLPFFSVASFWLAVFSYRGMTPIYPFLMIVLFWYGWRILKMNQKQAVALIIGTIIIAGSFLFVAQKYSDKGFMAEALFDKEKIQQDVDIQIRQSHGPVLIRRVFLNKPTYLLRKWQENYLGGYAFNHLFLSGEYGNIVDIPEQGKFYILDLLLIIPGALYLFKKNRAGAGLAVSLVLIAGLPGMIGGPIYLSRNFFLVAILPIFIAGGVLFAFEKLLSKGFKTAFLIIMTLIYLYFVGNFLFNYYGRFAFHQAENWFKSLKDVSLVIEQQKNKYDEIVVAPSSWQELLQYAFYTKMDPNLVQKAWQNKEEKSLRVGKIRFEDNCPDQEEKNPWLAFSNEEEKALIILRGDKCFEQATPSSRIKDFFGNTYWRIYE